MNQRISVIGNTNIDVVVTQTKELPAPGTERLVPSIDLRLGGSAGNLAVRCAELGQPTTLISRVGKDASTSLIETELQIPALNAVLVKDRERPCGLTVAVESDGRDRSFLSSLGAMAMMTANDVPRETLSAHFVVLAGYFLLPRFQGQELCTMFDRAKNAGATTVLDTGWPSQGWTPEVRQDIGAVLKCVDIFIPNEDELAGLTGKQEIAGVAVNLAQQTSTIVCVKRGSRGAGLATPDGRWLEEAALVTKVVDSTGAGDGFNAALLVAVVRGASWPDALATAVSYASRLVGRHHSERADIPLDQVVAS